VEPGNRRLAPARACGEAEVVDPPEVIRPTKEEAEGKGNDEKGGEAKRAPTNAKGKDVSNADSAPLTFILRLTQLPS
jgi:hypothetical protein